MAVLVTTLLDVTGKQLSGGVVGGEAFHQCGTPLRMLSPFGWRGGQLVTPDKVLNNTLLQYCGGT